MAFINLGTRNKGSFWEYISAYSFLNTKLVGGTEFEVRSFLGFGEGMPNQHCHDTEDIERYRTDVFWKEFDTGLYSSEFFTKTASSYRDDRDRLKSLVVGKNFAVCTSDEIATLCVQAVHYTSTTHKPMVQALYSMYLEKEFEAEIARVLSTDERADTDSVGELKAVLLTPPEESFNDREEDTILALENAYWKDFATYDESNLDTVLARPENIKILETLVADFGWFHMEYMHEVFGAKEYREEFVRRLTGGKTEQVSQSAAKREIAKRQEAFFASHKNTERLKSLMKVLHGFAFILDDSKVVAVEDNFYMRPLLSEAGKRLGLSWSETLLFTLPEIVSGLYLNKKIDASLVAEKLNHRLVLLKEGLITYYTGKEAVALAERLLPPEENKSEEVKGIVAYPGVVQGTVTLVKSVLDRSHFKKGAILVTHDGTAELTSLLKDAAAIVTDQGGMICHAAIVAREMKTPCIVGTKNATKVLKTGDRVEVDAKKGVVRVLSST